MIWLVILVLGAPFGLMLTGMAFEGGYTASAYLSVATVWSYPVFIVISFLLRNRHRSLLFLPAIPLLLIALESIL